MAEWDRLARLRMRYDDCIHNESSCIDCERSQYGMDCRCNPVHPLRYRREAAEMTPVELARAAHIPVQTIYDLESGHKSMWSVSASRLIVLCDAMECTLYDLLY